MAGLLRSIVFLFFCSSAFAQTTCPSGWLTSGDRCFLAVDYTEGVNYYEAQNLCEGYGGNLAVIDSTDLNTLIFNSLTYNTNTYWIGLHDIGTEGNFIWVDGTPYDPNQASWNDDEPNDYNNEEDCAEMNSIDGRWNDRLCSYAGNLGFVCQRPKDIPTNCDVDNGWDSINSLCYKYVSDDKTWEDARDYCELMGSEIVTVIDKDVQDYITSVSSRRLKNIWIGASDKITGTTGSYSWADGSALSYTNWKQGEPATANKVNCAEVVIGNLGKWSTMDCNVAQAFMCGKPEGSCDPGWQMFQGSCYQFNTYFPSTWTDAKHTCDAQGGHMITIDSQVENDYLVSKFENMRSAGITDVWIGLSDVINDGDLQWADSSEGPIIYLNWDSGEPKQTPVQDDCGDIDISNDDGYWKLTSCYLLHAYVCEIRVGQHPVPIDRNVEIGSCLDGWALHGDYCYKFDKTEVSFDVAETGCEAYGGTLTSIADSAEQSFISGRIVNVQALLWIGLHDRGTEGGYEWVDGTPYTFENWAPGEPNDVAKEDCVHLEYEQSKIGTWNDRSCGQYHGFTCKAPKINDGTIVTEAPEPTPAHDPKCGAGYEFDSSSNTCYKFAQGDFQDWPSADKICRLGGGHLLSIKDNVEQTFINARMYGMTSSVFWIGANDRTLEGGWEWSDGTPFAYLNWNDGEPNDYYDGITGEDCVEIIVYNGRWNDHKCEDRYIEYICENNGDIVDYFNVYRSNRLDGFDTLHLDNVYPEDCVQRCLSETSFFCLSIDYDRVNMSCELSRFTKETSGAGLTSDSDIDHYQLAAYPPIENTTTLAPNSRCEYGWYSYGSYCYFAQTVEMSWLDARDSCRREGADLVSIRDSNENQFIMTLMQTMCDSFHTDSTDDQYDYNFVATPVQNSRVTFEVKAASDVHIALSPNDTVVDPMYEVVIGGWGNTQSAIRRCAMCDLEVAVSTVDIVSATEYRAFWITFVNGKISVGKDGEAAFMEWTDPNPITVTYVGYTTGYGSSGDFILCTDYDSDSDFVWIGMNDLRTEMTYEWSDLTEVTYTRWNNGEPNNNGEEDCVHSYVSGSLAGYWNDDKCSDAYMSVCKKAKQVLAPTTQSSGDCGSGWYTQSHSCYRFVSNPAEWSAAESQCKSYGGSLVAINDNIEQSFVTIKLGALTGGSWYWIGLTDLSQAGQFTWSDGDPVTYTNWDASQPDNSQGDCVGVSTGSNAGLWTATQCSNAMPYICEKTRPGFTKAPVTQSYPTNPSDEGCAEGWLGYGDKCFLAFAMFDSDNRLTWDEALLDCRNRGGDLASFHSEDEMRYVKTNSKVIDFVNEFWIGLNDKDEENGFVWTDGSPVNFVAWDEGEPNDHNTEEDCVEMTMARPKGWNDRKCTRKKNWICQIPKGVMPASTVASVTHTVSSSCGDDLEWMYTLGACYYFSSGNLPQSRMSWETSRDFCLSHGGDLVSIHSGLEQEFVFSNLRDRRALYGWIGLREYTASGTHVWSDGTPLDYVYWDEQQPDDAYGSEKCVQIIGTDGEWNDINCGDRLWYVCKKSTSDNAPRTKEPTVLPTGNCPPGFKEYKNKCYSFNGANSDDTLGWTDARLQCGVNAIGGNLASIHSQEVQSFLSSYLREVNYASWIGLSDMSTPTKFRWQDGSEVDYTNWAADEPNGGLRGGEDCVEMYFQDNDGKWNDLDCSNLRGYVCQSNKDPSYPIPTEATNPCRDGYVHYYGACYKRLTGSYTWNSGKEACNSDESDLVSIENIYEQYYIETHMFEIESPIWIGLNDRERKGTYEWSDGSPVFYTKWAFGEPSYSTGEGCVQMTMTGGWDDTKCSNMRPTVCKYYLGNKPTTPAPVAGSCNFGNGSTWTEYHSACYNIDGISDLKNWAEASFECDQKGGYLATIGDEDEDNYIQNLIVSREANVWLGLSRNIEGGFQWVDGMALDYTHWGPGEPNNFDNNEDCVEKYQSSSEWNDNSCYASAGYICKRQKSTGGNQPNEGQPEEQSSGLSGGGIAGIVLGVVVAIVAALAVIYALFFFRKDSVSLTTKSSKDDLPPPVGFDNAMYSTSPAVSINDTVKLEFDDNQTGAAENNSAEA